MKKFLIFLLVICFITLSACNSSTNTGYDNTINLAVSELESFWKDYYDGVDAEQSSFDFSIKNTRLIKLTNDHGIEYLKDIDIIIEFVILTDYYHTNNKYLVNPGHNDTVIIYKDGRMEISTKSPIQIYMLQYYDITFPMVESVIDFGETFNKSISIKK